jgi:hypothetical protein
LFYSHINESKGIIYNYYYRNQLANLGSAVTGNLAADIERAAYTEGDLSGIVSKMNSASKQGVSKSAKGVIQWFIGAGTSVGLLSVSGNTPILVNSNITNSPGVYVNAGLDIYTNSDTRRVFFRIELANLSGKNKAVSSLQTSSLGAGFHDEFLGDRSSVSVTPQFGYNFISTPQFTLSANAGIGFNFSYQNKNSIIRYYNSGSAPADITPSIAFAAFTANVGVLGLEAQFNRRFGVYLKYRVRSGTTTNSDFDLGLSYFNGGLAYHF